MWTSLLPKVGSGVSGTGIRCEGLAATYGYICHIKKDKDGQEAIWHDHKIPSGIRGWHSNCIGTEGAICSSSEERKDAKRTA